MNEDTFDKIKFDEKEKQNLQLMIDICYALIKALDYLTTSQIYIVKKNSRVK